VVRQQRWRIIETNQGSEPALLGPAAAPVEVAFLEEKLGLPCGAT